MSTTRLTALAVIAALAVSAAIFFGFGLNNPNAATTRAGILGAGKKACFKDARADPRNVLLPDAKLTAFCGCVMDRSVGALTDEELRTTIGGASVGERMPMKLQAANISCKGELLD
jgi:hypothetical protein